jgi:hypothetical protein
MFSDPLVSLLGNPSISLSIHTLLYFSVEPMTLSTIIFVGILDGFEGR